MVPYWPHSTSRPEALTELKMLALDLKEAYLNGVNDPEEQLECTLHRLVRITDYIGGADAMNYVFDGKVEEKKGDKLWTKLTCLIPQRFRRQS